MQLEGRNAVLEALKTERTVDKLFIKSGEADATLKTIIAKARSVNIIIQDVPKKKLDEMSETNNHQGVIALCPEYEYAEVSDILALAESRGEPPFIIILDGITDPHNLGAIIRTADAAGAHGIIIPKRRSVGLSSTAAKAAAGAAEYLPVARTVNITRAIEDLKKQNIWVACADMDGQSMFSAPLSGAIALVIGSEGDGVSKLVSSKCDFSVSIPMYGNMTSLNASVAAGLLMYEVSRHRHI